MRCRALRRLGPLRLPASSPSSILHPHSIAPSSLHSKPNPSHHLQVATVTTNIRPARARTPPAPSSRPRAAQSAAVAAPPQPEALPAADIDVTFSSADSAVPAARAAPSAVAEAQPSSDGNSNPPAGRAIDWSSSFHGLSTAPFEPRVAEMLMRPVDPEDVEVKPDGIIYLPEIKYRRILNAAFGPGGWGLAPRGELIVGEKVVTREYALIVHGRFVAQARGECQYFSEDTIPTAGEGCKSNALMRCCKDLGIASELWDPRFIRKFKKSHCQEVWVEHVATKKRRQIWIRKDSEPAYPYALTKR